MEARIYTAWELCGDWAWVDKYYARQVRGSFYYETATASKNGRKVAMRRIQWDTVRTVTRYVDPDTKFVLIPIDTVPRGHWHS